MTALFERLREELSRGPANGDARGAQFAAARSLAERFWPVTAEREAGRGAKGIAKRVLRKLMRWYVEPVAADQRVFNDAALKLVDALSERADEEGRARERSERLLHELEERLTRLERRGRGQGAVAPVTVAAQPAAAGAWRRTRTATSCCPAATLALRCRIG